MSVDVEELRGRFEAAGQGHVFRHWDHLSEGERIEFAGQLSRIDLPLIQTLGDLIDSSAATSAPSLAPPEVIARGSVNADAEGVGANLLADGKVGFVLVAGGQGSRLGFDGPKGAYSIGPVTDRSLFDWHAARIQAAGDRYGFQPTWYIMTSRANDSATRAYFASHNHFGLGEDDVVFFSQDMLPALNLRGKIVLNGPGSIFLAPNGHGGTLSALATSGALAHMSERGIEEISYFQVDNPLARPADPLFLGLHRSAGADMSSKVVSKRDAAEKVGVLGMVDGVLGCIEYSDLSDQLREKRADSGDLAFNAGNIAVHALSVRFVQRLNEGGSLDLPWHVARKELDAIDDDGVPTKTDGVKFETFVFDALGKADNCVTMEVDRAEEFSPVKNAEGSDSPETCRLDLSRIGREITGTEHDVVEVDPRAAESRVEFEERDLATVERGNTLVVTLAE